MEKRRSIDASLQDQALPIPVQLYLWRQLRPFTRAKLGKLHEASCMFCQHAPGHHEMKEASTSFERVLVQSLHNELTPSLTDILGTVPRWRLIQTALPYVLHSAANLLHNKKDLQNLGPMETTLLYILHWFLLDAAEECAESDLQTGSPSGPFYYLFSVPVMTLFVYLFAPLCNHLKDIEFKTNLRLENGVKIWLPMSEFRHPRAACFTAHCRPKPRALWARSAKDAKPQDRSECGSDPPIATKRGKTEDPSDMESQNAGDQSTRQDEENWVSSPKDTVFPETIPEESSSTEDEHQLQQQQQQHVTQVILSVPSSYGEIDEASSVKDVLTIYAGEASIFHVAMGRKSSSSKSTLTIERVTSISSLDNFYGGKCLSTVKLGYEGAEESRDAEQAEEEDRSKRRRSSEKNRFDKAASPGEGSVQSAAGGRETDARAATFLDVAVLRCLFVSQWSEEGIYWALGYLYRRLRKINEECTVQQTTRRRSNSLPIPKIQVSIYQSPESRANKRDDTRESVDGAMEQQSRDQLATDVASFPDLSYNSNKPARDTAEASDSRRGSEKTKKRMKMADLKAFVEMRLLSKSEKALEKIGQEEPKRLYERECHRSLDTGDDRLTRRAATSWRISDGKDESRIQEHSTNLIKGKSMPSLRYYIGDTRIERNQSRFYSQSYASPNPIITVTEHTPAPSPDYLKRQGSIDSQLDAISVHGSGGLSCSDSRKPSLTRSQTDSNITYTGGDEIPEAPGSAAYITKEGDIDCQVVLKAIHSVALRDATCCTLRVCEIILNMVELLMKMGVLKQCLREETMRNDGAEGSSGPEAADNGSGRKQDSPVKDGDPRSDLDGKPWTAHALLLNCAVRVMKHLGCPHGCAADGIRAPQGEFARSQAQQILGKLYRASSRQFSRSFRSMIRYEPIPEILDLFHSYVGFCVDPSSLLSPLNQKRSSSKSPDVVSQGAYATNFGAGMIGNASGIAGGGIAAASVSASASALASATAASATASYGGILGYGARNTEGRIIGCIFKTLVSRFVKSLKEIKSQENMAIYCDIKQFTSYVKEAHGGVFRRVALGCILDSADRPNKRFNSTLRTTRVIRHIHQPDYDENAELAEESCYTIDDRGTRKCLFKKRSTSSTCASLLETELSEENAKIMSQSPLGNLRKKHQVLTPRQSERNLGIGESSKTGKSRKSGRFKIGGIVNWFRKEYGRTDSSDSRESSESPTDATFVRQSSLHRARYHGAASRTSRGVSQTLQRAKRRMEDQLNKIGLGKGKKKESLEEAPGSYFSRRNSMDFGETCRESEFVVLKERRLVPRLAIHEGLQRFSFLLEMCQPGSVPDHHLIAALLDLPHAPVVARASLLLECAHLVHRCNKGQWPVWMKLNFPIFRGSVPMANRNAPTGLRRTHVLQRAAGKLFYQWAESIGARLEELMAEDKRNIDNVIAMVSDESKQRELLLEDEEEDFLDEGDRDVASGTIPVHKLPWGSNSILRYFSLLPDKDPMGHLIRSYIGFLSGIFIGIQSSINGYGSQCPVALRMVACILLLEVTAFLRETYQTLPKSSRVSTKERPPPWERVYSREANRRWSMALSSMGHSQTSAQSLQSIAGDRDNERKISFVLHEPDNESEGSSKSTVTMHGEELSNNEREKSKRIQGRPFLLRRGTAGNATGSFKRRSLKLARGAKEGRESECEAFVRSIDTGVAAVRRTDSIQSKRKVSSLSDRSDTSEPGAGGGAGGGGGEVSGEESPGILSDDQPPESPSDSNDTDETNKNFPWLKVLAQALNSFNFYCSHQNFCHPYCHRRQMRASARLVKSVRKVYGEQFGIGNNGKFGLDQEDKRDDSKKEKRPRKISEQTSAQVSPVRRKDSVGKRFKIDKSVDGSGRLTGGGHRDSSKDLADQDSERGRGSSKRLTSGGLTAAVAAAAVEEDEDDEKDKRKEGNEEPAAIFKYIKTQVKDAFHAPLASLVKGAVVVADEVLVDVLPVAWELLLESNQEVAASAASLFIVGAVKAPNQASEIMHQGLQHAGTSIRINAILRFQVLWKLRYQVWPRMEEPAHVTLKVPPPGIEFTLPSPKIGIESLPVVDPPWMPQVKTKVEEVTIDQERHRSLVTATKTRKKQQTELIKKALQAQDDKKREERENFLITTIPITVQAAYEPSPAGDDHDEGAADEEGGESAPRNTSHHAQSALSLFPSSLCSAIVRIINLLDDAAVSEDGNSVYEVAYQVIWSCLVEDSALFLRYVLERLTREKQELMFKILRHLIRFVPKLPQQAAFALYNYIIGYVMFYVRSPHEEGQKLIGTALSILWMVVHSVHGIMFKDLKQILRKEQCDASILLTANVPSAKKIIVHGAQDPDAGGIPSQFPVQEDTQFCQILRESLDFFGIDEAKHREYFLVDYKTRQIHNPSAYVRDYYFFKRSQYPQLELVHMKPEEAFNALQRQELVHKFVEIGKVLLTWAILKNVDMVVQRVVFLHEELMKLPSFPRKALEADLDLYKGGEIGRELLGLDVMHKFMWVRLIARMFEAMAGNFAYSGDIHLFLNVLNGAVILHSEDSCILRYVVATYINAAHNFKNIFSTNGYLLIMPSLLQLYATHRTNKLVTTTVEYAVKQFYLMNRKPFILQMFGSVSTILDTDETSTHGEAHKVPSTCLFNLLLSLETPSPDPLNIGELVKEEKPLKAIDFCYHDENEMVTVLDCISLCVMVIAYAADSIRGQQMLTILEAILPCYVQQIQSPTYNKEGKTEKEIIQQLAIAVKTLVNNSEALAKYYNGPQRSSPEHKGSSQRNYGKAGPYSPGFDFEEDTHVTGKYMEHGKGKNMYERGNEDTESCHRKEFRRPRDTLLNMVGEFVARSSARLAELNKKSPDGKTMELLDSKCHVRLADVAHSLLKMSPYDPETMGCRGLKRYMNDVLPSTEWSNDDMRPALTVILRRLDKTFGKIYKKASVRRNTDWDAASDLLRGVYETLSRYPYIAHFQYLKTLLGTCQALVVGDTGLVEVTSAATAALMSKIPPQHFCSTVLRLIALHVISLGEGYSLENVCGGQAMFATQTRTENMLLNLLIPLFLRVGTGRKDVPKLRQSDISFALTAVLNTLWPPGTKTAPIVSQNLKTAADVRAGSLTFTARDPKISTRISLALYRVAFLALKIMTICFETELKTEWPKILRTMRLLNKRNEASVHLWNFLEFVVTHRTPLYIQMLPFIVHKIGQPPISEHERNMQSIIRNKMSGERTCFPKSRGTLLGDLLHELRDLKEEIEDRKFDEMQPELKRNVVDAHPGGPNSNDPARTQRPSLLIDLLTGDLGSRAHIVRTPAETPISHSGIALHPPDSIHRSVTSSSGSTTTTKSSTGPGTRVSPPANGLGAARGSVSSTSAGSSTLRESSDVAPGESQTDKPRPTGEPLTSQPSLCSPTEDSSGESRLDKPRLQRSMGQSKRTFRLRKSRKSHVDIPHLRLEQRECLPVRAIVQSPPSSALDSSLIGAPSESSSLRSRTSSHQTDRGTDSTDQHQEHHHRQQQQQQQQQQQHHHHHHHHHHHPHRHHNSQYPHHHLHPQSDISWDEDTSSTSGYRESYSLRSVSLEGNNARGSSAPPLASPDLNDVPSTSSTNYTGYDGSSPDCSMNGSGGEKTALLNSSQRTESQNSLLMVFQTRDEDTLI